MFVKNNIMIKRGTFTKKGKPTRFAVELYLKYFELGGKPNDDEMNPLISERIQQIMGWKDGEGIVCLMWGINSKTKNSKVHDYHVPMIKAKELAWDIYNNCV
jgi:hypothetical protein